MCKIFNTFLFFTVFIYSIDAQESRKNFKDKIKNILTEIYHFQITKAEKDLSKLHTSQLPENQYYYLKANLQWWHILNGENDQNNQNLCLKYVNQSINANEEDKNLEDKLTLLSDYMLKMRVNNLNNNQFKSTILLIKTLNLSEKLINEMPESGQKNFIQGIYHYFTNFAKEESYIARILLSGYSGKDKETGLEYLKKAAMDTDTVVQTEAHYLLYKIYSTLENDEQKALNHIKWLSQTYPENIFYKTEYYLTLCKNDSSFDNTSLKYELIQQINTSTELNETEKRHYFKIITSCKTKN